MTDLDIELMIAELRSAGWREVRVHVWRSPCGALFLGPYQAWRVMKGLERHD